MLRMMDHPLPIANHLLAGLTLVEYKRLLINLEQVQLTFGQVLYEPGATIKYLYFPNDALISLLSVVDHHHALEVGMTGPEGLVGIPFVLGAKVSSLQALVQGTGTAMRINLTHFRQEFKKMPSLQRSVQLYTNTLIAQIAQTAACNHFHFVEARLARWLLMTSDRLSSDHFYLTQEFLANMLGVRRVGVTKAAHSLKLRQLIDYSRGNMSILNRRELENVSCSCYEAVKA